MIGEDRVDICHNDLVTIYEDDGRRIWNFDKEKGEYKDIDGAYGECEARGGAFFNVLYIVDDNKLENKPGCNFVGLSTPQAIAEKLEVYKADKNISLT